MKESRDFAIVFHINQHFEDIQKDLVGILSAEAFTQSGLKRRAILFDFLQIGELLNQLSQSFLREFGNEDALKIIAIRNRVVHGYSSIKDSIIYNALRDELPPFMNSLNAFADNRYLRSLRELIGQKVVVYHHESEGFWIERLTTLSGGFQKVILLNEGPTGDVFGKAVAQNAQTGEYVLLVGQKNANPKEEYLNRELAKYKMVL